MFDQPIGVPRLDLSILNTVTGLYLGPSIPGRPSWIKQQTTFFPAIRAGGEGSKIFRIGPEVTFYIQEGTYVEIASADGSMREELSWEGVLLRSSLAGTENWASRPEAFELGPDGPAAANSGQAVHAPDLDKVRRDEQEAILSKQRQEDRLRAEKTAAAILMDQQVAAQKRAEDLAADQRSKDEAIRRKQREDQFRAEEAAAAQRAEEERRLEDQRLRDEAATLAKRKVEEEAQKREEEVAAAKRTEEEAALGELEEDRLRTVQAGEIRQASVADADLPAETAIEHRGAQKESIGHAADGTGHARSAEVIAESILRGDDQAFESSKRPGKSKAWTSAVVVAAIGVPILIFGALVAIGIGVRQSRDPGYLCLRFEMFCSQESQTATASTPNAVVPPTQNVLPPATTPATSPARPAANVCATKAMGSYGNPTPDRVRAYIATHKAMRLAPNGDLDRIAQDQCFAGKDDYARSYFAIWAASVNADSRLPGDLTSEFNAELAATIKPTDDPNLRLPEPPPAADAKSSPSNSQRRRR